MRKTALLAFVTLFVLAACGNKSDVTPANTPVAKVQIPKVKYPAAIVFEGGKGIPDSIAEKGTQITPSWRLTLCLEKTAFPVTREVLIDFNELGNPMEQKWVFGETKEHLYTQRLNSVLLKYTYTSQLVLNLDEKMPSGKGNTQFESSSKQEWQTIFKAPNFTPSERSYHHHIFDMNIWTSTMKQFSKMGYELDSENFYITHKLEQFEFFPDLKIFNIIEVCEREDQPTIWQYGKDI